MFIADKISELVGDILIKNYQNIRDEKKLKKEIAEFIEHEYSAKLGKLNDEIDYTGICDYINSFFLKDLDECLYNTEFKIRERSYKTIIEKCLYYGKTRDRSSVENFINNVINIIETFQKKKMSKEDVLLSNSNANDIITTISHEVKSLGKSLKKEINNINRITPEQGVTEKRDINTNSCWINEKSGEKFDPNKIYQKGIIKAQFGGDKVCSEYTLPDGNTTYCEIDSESGAVMNLKLAYPKCEYKWDIPENLIVKEEDYHCTVDGLHCIAKVIHLKFGRKVTKAFDKGVLVDFDIRARFFIDDTNKTIHILDYTNEINNI